MSRRVSFFAILACAFAVAANAAQVNLAWDAPSDVTRIVGYEVGVGSTPATYTSFVDAGKALTTTVPNLADNATYYFAVRAYGANGERSSFTNEVKYTTGSATTPPKANFSASPSSGNAPLTVQFANLSTGAVSTYAWSFGDGGTSTLANPSHVYQSAGTYAVTLTVNGAAGASTSAPSTITVTTGSQLPPTNTIGEAQVLPDDDSGNGNLLVAQWVTLSAPYTLQSISFYVTQSAGQLRLGLYKDAGGRPGALQAQTNAVNAVVGWNTLAVAAPVLLPAGKYWLAYLASADNLHFRKGPSGGTSGIVWYAVPSGALPATFSTSPASDPSVHFSLYATLTAGPNPPPPTDKTPPIVTITSPASGALLRNGNVSITASATDNVRVVSMVLTIDGTQRLAVSGASLSYGWSLKNVVSGQHIVAVTARDAAGNSATKSETVTKR